MLSATTHDTATIMDAKQRWWTEKLIRMDTTELRFPFSFVCSLIKMDNRFHYVANVCMFLNASAKRTTYALEWSALNGRYVFFCGEISISPPRWTERLLFTFCYEVDREHLICIIICVGGSFKASKWESESGSFRRRFYASNNSHKYQILADE